MHLLGEGGKQGSLVKVLAFRLCFPQKAPKAVRNVA